MKKRNKIIASFKTNEEYDYVRRMLSLTELTEKQFARIALMNEAYAIEERVKKLLAEQQEESSDVGEQKHLHGQGEEEKGLDEPSVAVADSGPQEVPS